jgi:Tol biopolymer transport system component
VELDADAGRVIPPSKSVTQRIGENLMPAWSPDGQRLAYVARGRGVIVRDLATGDETVLPTGSRDLWMLRWSPGGDDLLARGRDHAGRYGWFTIDSRSGRLSPIKVVPRPEESFLSPVHWDRDGSSILYLAADPSRLVRRRVSDGNEETLLTLEKGARIGPGDPFLSASVLDGSIAFVQSHERQTSLRILKPDRTVETVLENSPGEAIRQVAWLPENRGLIFTRVKTDVALLPEARWPVIWSIDLRDRSVRSLDITMDGIRSITVSRDGRRLAFSAGFATVEPWVLENALPATAPATSRARR